MMSNIQLEDYCRENRFPLIDVICKDELNNMIPKIGSYYINLQDSDKGNGNHWLMFRIFPNNKAIYFDSFGMYAPKNIDEFLHKFKPYGRNNRQIQDLNSESCGRFCLATDKYFTDHYDKQMNLDDNFCNYLSIYSNNLKQNDNIVKEYLKKN